MQEYKKYNKRFSLGTKSTLIKHIIKTQFV